MEESPFLDPLQPANPASSYTSSPEHSRARPQRQRAAKEPLPRIRRRERSGDATRRGRSYTRSISPAIERRKDARTGRGARRRSRSPSREEESVRGSAHLISKRRKDDIGINQGDLEVEQPREAQPRDENLNPPASPESSRSRSKKRRRYRRRSDYAAERFQGEKGKSDESHEAAVSEGNGMVIDVDDAPEIPPRRSGRIRDAHGNDHQNNSIGGEDTSFQMQGARKGRKR